MIFIDTNYFLRLLLQDDDNQHKKAEKLFLEAAEGKVLVFTSIIVIFEIYWVLKSHYKKTNRQIYEFLTKILKMRFISLPEANLLQETVQIFLQTNFGLEDCYHLIYSKEFEAQNLATFDEKLLKEFNK